MKGFSLSELLISLALASFIVLSFVNSYLKMKKEYISLTRKVESDFDMLEVVALMRYSIWHAGFTPCGNIESLITTIRKASAISSQPNAFTINRMEEIYSQVLQVVTPTQLYIKNFSGIKAKQKILIADCYHAEVKQVEQLTKNSYVTLDTPLIYSYQNPIAIGEWLEEKFYIKKTKTDSDLMYQMKSASELTSEINSLTLHLDKKKRMELVTVFLGVKNGKNIQFDTRVRE